MLFFIITHLKVDVLFDKKWSTSKNYENYNPSQKMVEMFGKRALLICQVDLLTLLTDTHLHVRDCQAVL